MIAVVVAVENYSDSRFASVPFAEDDAKAVRMALKGIGVDDGNLQFLVSSGATKTTVESRLRTEIARLHEDDVFYFFYAGHGFSRAGCNYITCYDTQNNDIQRTSVKLQEVFRWMKDSRCERIILFLDSCESGIPADPSMRTPVSDLSDDELREFFQDAQHCYCFASCKTDESSYSHDSVKHGVWTHHLVEALTGKATAAIERQRHITSSSLQSYLSVAVPRTLRTARRDRVSQTPMAFGSQTREFLVADIGPLLEQEARQRKSPKAPELREAVFRSLGTTAVRSLRGFVKGRHHPPKWPGSSADAFVGSIAEKDIEEDIKAVRDAMRQHLGYGLGDLKVSVEDGSGGIIAPDFDYKVWVSSDSDDLDRVLWEREVSSIQNPEVVLSDGFQKIFPRTFDTLEIALTERLPIKQLLEMLDGVTGVHVDCSLDMSQATLRLDGLDGEIKVCPSSVAVVLPEQVEPRRLVLGFAELQAALAAKPEVGKLPIPDQGAEE